MLREVAAELPNMDFAAWQMRRLNFADLADDPLFCLSYITAYAGDGR